MAIDPTRRRFLESIGGVSAVYSGGFGDDYDSLRTLSSFSVPASRLTTPPDVNGTRTYLTDTNAEASSLVGLSNGGFAIAGTKSSDRGERGFLLTLDSTGMVQSTHSVGDAIRYSVTDFIVDSESGFVLVGERETNSGSQTGFVRRTDAKGRRQWEEQLPGTESTLRCVHPGPDGRIICGGFRRSDGSINPLLVSYALDGTREWIHEYQTPGTGSVEDISSRPDGGWMAVGQFTPPDAAESSGWIGSVSDDGTPSFGTTVDQSGGGRLVSVTRVGTDYYAVGDVHDTSAKSRTGWLYVFDEEGNRTWQHTRADSQYQSVIGIGDDILCGGVTATGEYESDALVQRWTPTKDMVWEQTFDQAPIDFVRDLKTTSDGGLLVTGFTSPIDGANTVWVVKAGGETPFGGRDTPSQEKLLSLGGAVVILCGLLAGGYHMLRKRGVDGNG